jgi:hypothetical protein
MGISADTFISVWRGTAWKVKLWGRNIRQLLSTSNGPINITESLILQVVRAAGTPAPRIFTPMYKQDFASGVVGNADPDWRFSEFTDVRSVSGTKCVQLGVNRGYPPPSCGGSHFWGNRQSPNENAGLPAPVPIGKTLWYRVFHYFPSTFSFGYLFLNGTDNAEASACGKSADGNYSGMKWLHLAPNAGTRRIYHHLPSGRRKIAQPLPSDPENSGQRIQSEVAGSISQSIVPIPLDRWVAIQIAVYVTDDNTGWVRVWNDETLICEKLGIPTVFSGDGATAITDWGLGDYWNGVPYTDGAVGRDNFFIDEIIIASDVDGYGSPTGVDANGNAYIDPATRVGDL